ncbi:TonB-dependent receptor plug domain-containing protein [Bacteroides congonensis]
MSMRRALSVFSVFLFLVVTIPVVSAQERHKKYYKSRLDSIQRLDTVVITGQRLNKYRDVIPAQVMTFKDLEKLNSLSVADAIRFFSGVQLKDYGGVGGLKTVNIRSMGTNHMGVFYDGIQLGNAQNGQIDLGKFSLDNVEEISLYNGQKSEIFQSAKDFGASGTIYITTRKPRFTDGKSANFKATLRTGSFGLINPSLLYEQKLTDKISTSFSGEWINASGKYEFRYRRRNTLGEVMYDTTAVRQNGDINSTRMEAGLHGKINNGQWTLRGYTYNSERGVPGAIVNNVFRNGERLWDTNSFIQGTFTKEVSSRYRTLVNAKYAADYTHYENHDSKLFQTKNTYRQKEIYVSTANLYSLTNFWDASLAYDFQWNKLDAEFNSPNNESTFPFPQRFTNMVALATAVDLKQFKLQGSCLGYFVHEKVRRFAKSPDKAVFTPAVFASYRPFKYEDFSLRAFYKEMFRMPTFNDLYYTDMGNAFLKPEYTAQYNVGFKYKKEFQHSLYKLFDLQVDAYYNEVKDKIIAYPKGQQFRWTMLNLGYVEIRGIDVSLHQAVGFGKFLANVKMQYTYQKAQDFTDPSKNYFSHQIPYIPWHSGSLIAALEYGSWALSYCFIYTGERYNQQENIAYNHTQPWYTSDINVVKYLKVKSNRMKLSLEVNNLFSQDYDVILNYPMPKRNFRFLISIDI